MPDPRFRRLAVARFGERGCFPSFVIGVVVGVFGGALERVAGGVVAHAPDLLGVDHRERAKVDVHDGLDASGARGLVVEVHALAEAHLGGEGAWRTLFRAGPGLVPMDLTKDGKFERSDDWSSTVYFYLDRPTNDLPAIDAVGKRIAGL